MYVTAVAYAMPTRQVRSAMAMFSLDRGEIEKRVTPKPTVEGANTT